ncbi:unnamed protein product [Cyprideis torosa]|uniref:plant cystathionine gamma-synthase n=1 Tax=Cyprideis torosa TaxID=163714 RepID=A0A7R8WMG6_9CRUS|nr:unnamed protein product [Cyprideis torosa]CAG0905317.1 unnamed protein product [Cyprideis torosa]
MADKIERFETAAIRTQIERGKEREHSSPIFPTSGYIFHSAEQMEALFKGEEEGNIYSRYSNPNCTEFEDKMKKLERMPFALASASGMASVFSCFMGLLEQGDHILSSRALFGSTIQVLNHFLPKYGIEHTSIDGKNIESWTQALRPNTKMLFIESPSNPGLDLIDLEQAAAFARAHNLIFAIDNCFATPYLQNPSDFGADVVVHSATKFIDGQGRVGGGVVLMQEPYYEPIKYFQRQTGPSLSPFNAWILSKSLETLAVRMDKHCANALELAARLEGHSALNFVKYPFLPSHPDYAIAKKQMKQGGGLITIEVKGGLKSGQAFLNKLQMLSISANLGDTRTIVTHPATSTHSKLSPEEREAVNIGDGLIRISVGLEHIDDITNDIVQALDGI